MVFNNFGFDLTTLLTDIGQATGIIPKTQPIAPPAPPMIVQTGPRPIATIAGIAITPAKLAVGLAAAGAVIYFARKKRGR